MELRKIMSAGGLVSVQQHIKARKEIILTAQKIRRELGGKSPLLDEYMLAMFTALSKISVLDAVDEGYQDASTELRELVKSIRSGDTGATAHPFYQTVKDYISTHPCPTEEIYTDYYCASLSLEFAEFALMRYMENREGVVAAVLEEAKIEELKSRLASMVSAADLERLSDALFERFLIASPAKIFLQCMTDQCILCDLMQDKDSRHVFQHVIDTEIV